MITVQDGVQVKYLYALEGVVDSGNRAPDGDVTESGCWGDCSGATAAISAYLGP